MRVRRIAAITAAGLAVAGGAGAAIAATSGDDAKKAEDTVIKDAAQDLNVSPGRLRDALSDATAAQLDRELDRAVGAGELTRKQADQIKARHKGSGRVLGLGPGPGHGPGFRGRGPAFPGPPPGPRGGPFQDLAKALGISRAKLHSELREGQSLREIARAEGRSLDEVKRALRASAKARLDRAVKNGDLTERQANARRDHLEDHLDRLGSARPFGPPPGHGGTGGHGGFPGGPGGMRR